MANSNTNMANREVADLIFVDYSTKKPFLNLDFANVTTTELTGENVYAYGSKGHAKKVAFTGERGGTVTIETQIQTMKLWQLITGGEVSKTAKIMAREILTVSGSGSSLTLSETPIAGSVVIYKVDDDCGTPLATTGEGTAITLTSALSDGDKVIAYYIKEVNSGVERINIKATSFPKSFIVYGDTIMKTEDDEVLPLKMTIYKCVPQSNISLGFSNNGDPASLSITCDMLANSDDELMDLAVIEE